MDKSKSEWGSEAHRIILEASLTVWNFPNENR